MGELERSTPEARHVQAAKSAAAPAAEVGSRAAAPHFRPESAGLVALGTELLAIGGNRRQLTDALRETDALLKEVDDLRAPLTAEARDFARRTDIAATRRPTPRTRRRRGWICRTPRRSSSCCRRRSYRSANKGSRLKIRAPRSPNGATTSASSSGKPAGSFLLRGLVLVLAIAALLIISEVWRRATFRYLHDVRRRRQFLVLRRVVVSVGVALVLVAAFVSEIGSLATYAGFVTAGVAVAMQNVILAVVAYFFLIGRYGVRVGDRITLAGVTGSVIEIGLVRIYLMELAGPDLRTTGRIVVLSNAVLFQPAALFKQAPGADYLWHVVTVTLAASSEIATAEERLESAAESIYEDYRASINGSTPRSSASSMSRHRCRGPTCGRG